VLHLPDDRAVEQFLGPLPIQALHGIGPPQAAQLRAYGLQWPHADWPLGRRRTSLPRP
jgi:nucleotidyltransferase/DNA polymerase involved in DNA repair